MLSPKEAEKSRQHALLPFMDFLTYSSVGNPLGSMAMAQRQFFFESIFRMLHLQRVEDKARTAALGSGAAAVSACVAGIAALRAEAEREKRLAQLMGEKGKPGGEPGAPSAPFGAAGAGAQAVSGAKAAVARPAEEQLAFVLDDYARGDGAKAMAALSEFDARLKSQGYKAEDLMAVLLLVIEDKIWSGEEAGVGGAAPAGSGVKIPAIPAKLRETALESAEARLASVREMLRYYFARHPEEYAPALASALGITADQEEDVQFLQERLAFELARIGSFALAQKILASVKLRKKMDTEKCLLELGYSYDRKRKKLILGKRTCGKPVEARGVIGLLMGSLKGKAKAPQKGAS